MPTIHRLTPRAALVVACAVALSCAGVQRPQKVTLRETGVSDPAALAGAVEAFYAAKDEGALRAALSQAEGLAPDAGATHELRRSTPASSCATRTR